MLDLPRCNACGSRLQDASLEHCPNCDADLSKVGLYQEPKINPIHAVLWVVIGVSLASVAGKFIFAWLCGR